MWALPLLFPMKSGTLPVAQNLVLYQGTTFSRAIQASLTSHRSFIGWPKTLVLYQGTTFSRAIPE